VGTAASGEEACAKAAELDPDLVLMDVRIAGRMEGIEAADQRFRQDLLYRIQVALKGRGRRCGPGP
jgi:CheY-like chemotaxis protein